jgi:hypothetical protein
VTEKCVLCGGPIAASEQVYTLDNGMIHWEKKACEDFINRQRKPTKGPPKGPEAKPKDKPPRNRRLKVKKAGNGG